MGEQTLVTGEEKKTEAESVAKKEQSRKRKWLGWFGTFLMMGGWMVIVVLGLIIAIVISLNFK